MRMRSTVITVVTSCLLSAVAASARSPEATNNEKALYRIFLQDGTALVSYGEYARVADRVVFSVPIGALEPAPRLQLVSIADAVVDWPRTEEYADAVRAKRYVETRAEDDFAILSNHVAAALNEVAHTKDPARRLALAEEARGNLAEWPKRNYGYRASDVTQLLWLLDDVIAPLRAAAGQTRFDVSLYATTAPPARPELLPAPDARGSVENALAVARLAQPAERVSLLRAIGAALAPVSAGGWEWALRERAGAELAAELRIDEAYANLTRRTTQAADRRARRADVRGIQRLVQNVLVEDGRMGGVRPQETTALLAALDERLDAARRLRLARDAWTLRGAVLRRYKGAVEPVIAQLRRSRSWLGEIRALAGPAPRALATLERRMTAAARTLARVMAPAEAQPAHGLLASAAKMSARAAQTRRHAVQSNDMALAWDASSAAAGALMMFERALDEIDTLTSPPRFR